MAQALGSHMLQPEEQDPDSAKFFNKSPGALTGVGTGNWAVRVGRASLGGGPQSHTKGLGLGLKGSP